ncbi:MAG TPA: hypothetical protein VGP79_17845 [Bryobacteraceae bacterium]|nr:hypothetical protein [Bryobacteraceae bacterium]
MHVVITNQYDDVVEDGFYQAPNGVLNFTEGFFAGTFHVTTTRKGGHDVIDDFYIEITTPSLP